MSGVRHLFQGLGLDFPNDQNFNDVELAYRDFKEKLTKIIDKVAPSKKSKIKKICPQGLLRAAMGSPILKL